MKKILAIICTIICMLTMGGCVELCIGGFGFSLLLCTAVCNQPESYSFIHETADFDDVKIELVTVEYDRETYKYSIETVKEIGDKTAFIEEFKAVGFTYPFEPPNGLAGGKGVCFTYPDGQVEVVTSFGCGLFADRSLEERIRFHGASGTDGLIELWDKWAQ